MEKETSDLRTERAQIDLQISVLTKIIRTCRGKYLLIALLVILLLGVGVGGYYLGIKQGRVALVKQPEKRTVPIVVASPSPKPPPSPAMTPTPIPGTSYYTSKELNISFEYPNALGEISEGSASERGSHLKGIGSEDWWQINFEQRGFSPGYYQISASTPNYMPDTWEGTGTWFNEKITLDDTEAIVKKKLESSKHAIKVEKVNSTKGILVFRVWSLSCYAGCTLVRAYLFPLDESKYTSIVIYTILSETVFELGKGQSAPALALEEVEKIEKGQVTEEVRRYIEWQDLIFNSLTFNN